MVGRVLKFSRSPDIRALFAFFLLLAGNTIQAVEPDDEIFAAIWADDAAKVSKLLRQKTNINKQDDRGDTPLILAASLGKTKIAGILIRAGANLEMHDFPKAQENPVGFRAMHSAAHAGHAEVLKLLIRAGAKIEARGNYGLTPLMYAAGQGNVAATRVLIKAGAKVNAKGEDGYTALGSAAEVGHAEAVQVLIQAGAKVTAVNSKKETALMLASGICFEGHVATVRVLLTARQNLEAKDEAGETALMKAARAGCNDTVSYLLKSGAKVDTEDKQGLSALTYANSAGQNQAEEILRAAGAKDQFDYKAAEKEAKQGERYCKKQKPYRLGITFISYGAGTDSGAHAKIKELIQSHPAKLFYARPEAGGPEGEFSYCLDLDELKAEEQKAFIEEVRKAVSESSGVGVCERCFVRGY